MREYSLDSMPTTRRDRLRGAMLGSTSKPSLDLPYDDQRQFSMRKISA